MYTRSSRTPVSCTTTVAMLIATVVAVPGQPTVWLATHSRRVHRVVPAHRVSSMYDLVMILRRSRLTTDQSTPRTDRTLIVVIIRVNTTARRISHEKYTRTSYNRRITYISTHGRPYINIYLVGESPPATGATGTSLQASRRRFGYGSVYAGDGG